MTDAVKKSAEDAVSVNDRTDNHRNPMHNSLKYITLVRSIYAVLVLVYCIIWFSKIGWDNLENDAMLLLGSVVEIFIFTTLCCISLLKEKFVRLATYVGMFHDSILAAIFVLCTGLATSPFFYLFLIVPLYGGIILQRKGGLIAATAVSVVMIGFLYIAPMRFAAWMSLPNLDSIHLLGPFFLLYLILAAYSVGLLTGHLSHLYASVSDSLVQADIEFSHLKGVYAIMLNALPIGILIVSPDTKRILYHNPSARELLGPSLAIPEPTAVSAEFKSAARSDPDAGRVDTASHDKCGNQVFAMSLQAKEAAPPVEWTSIINDKCLHIAQFTVSLHKSSLVGYHIIDFTAQYQAQKERAQRARLMHLGEFSAKVAHEIRNPLACISGCNEMLQLDARDEEQIQIHEMMNGEINRLNHLLNDILVFSRKPKLSPKSFSLKKLVESQCERFVESPEHKNVQFDLDIPDDLDIFADETSFRQILMTLWQNSSEAMNGDGEICVSASLPLEIVISDSGPGIGEKDALRIFEPFYTTKQSGTGLGLATARQIAGDNGFVLSWSAVLEAFTITAQDDSGAQSSYQT